MCFIRKTSLSLLLLLWMAAAQSSQDIREDARKLMETGEAEAAYALLLSHEAELVGEFNFDYLFGIAALGAGKPDVAVFALERAVASHPDSAYAHADLAQAYLALGDRDAAKSELAFAAKLKPDPRAGVLIQQRRNLLMQAEHASRGHWNAYMEFGLGYDNNVNSATSSRDLVIPAFGAFTFTLGGNSIKLASRVTQLGGGVGVSYPLGEHTEWFGRVAGVKRVLASHNTFDTSSLELATGVMHSVGTQHFTVSLSSQDFALNRLDYRYTYSLNGQWQMELDTQTQAGAFAQIGKLVYPDARLRNTSRYVGGVFAGHTFAGEWKPAVHVSLYGGHEAPETQGVAFMGHRLTGARAGLEATLSERLSAYLTAGYEYRAYGGEDALFLLQRTDHQRDLGIGAAYQLPHGFSIRPSVHYVENSSNIPLNRFDRLETLLVVRKEF